MKLFSEIHYGNEIDWKIQFHLTPCLLVGYRTASDLLIIYIGEI